MNYPVGANLDIVYDTATMENEIALDTLQAADYTRRIEYRHRNTAEITGGKCAL